MFEKLWFAIWESQREKYNIIIPEKSMVQENAHSQNTQHLRIILLLINHSPLHKSGVSYVEFKQKSIILDHALTLEDNAHTLPKYLELVI